MNSNEEVSTNSTDIMGKSAITDDNDVSLSSLTWIPEELNELLLQFLFIYQHITSTKVYEEVFPDLGIYLWMNSDLPGGCNGFVEISSVGMITTIYF